MHFPGDIAQIAGLYATRAALPKYTAIANARAKMEKAELQANRKKCVDATRFCES